MSLTFDIKTTVALKAMPTIVCGHKDSACGPEGAAAPGSPPGSALAADRDLDLVIGHMPLPSRLPTQ
jgi:hypothetical protein